MFAAIRIALLMLAAVLLPACRTATPEAAALRFESDGAYGFAVAVEIDGARGYLTPLHVFEKVTASDGIVRLGGAQCRIAKARVSTLRDIAFFSIAEDPELRPRLSLKKRSSPAGRVDFMLPAEPESNAGPRFGSSGTPGIGRFGETGLFIGLRKDTQMRVYVRIDNLTAEEFIITL